MKTGRFWIIESMVRFLLLWWILQLSKRAVADGTRHALANNSATGRLSFVCWLVSLPVIEYSAALNYDNVCTNYCQHEQSGQVPHRGLCAIPAGMCQEIDHYFFQRYC